ncbi:hypothetical protein MKW98_024438 [Papaver atlanticum]|uniref:peptidylprolyl isomerase n=1 Tax=Papaver atlanticum TaxID=357466 RepID=A0AAD4XPQ0_9MAGN|nr:hypothetical protein MKW98_024438 [Papaver atlanticum]
MCSSRVSFSHLEKVHRHLEQYFERFSNLLGAGNGRYIQTLMVPTRAFLKVLLGDKDSNFLLHHYIKESNIIHKVSGYGAKRRRSFLRYHIKRMQGGNNYNEEGRSLHIYENLSRSEVFERAEKKDEVTVKYEVKLEDGTVVEKSPEGGVEFLVNDGHLCPAIAKAVVTMWKEEKAILRVEPESQHGLCVLIGCVMLGDLHRMVFRPFLQMQCQTVEPRLRLDILQSSRMASFFYKKGHDEEDLLEFKWIKRRLLKALIRRLLP